MWKLCLWLVLAVCTLSTRPAEAVTITPADLPAAYRDCANCSVGYESAVDIRSMSAFRVLERASGGTQLNWLLRYSVYSSDSTSPSHVWLHARSSYDMSLSDHHPLTLLLDQAALPPGSSWLEDADPTDWDFTVTSEALLSGSAQYAARCCESGTPELSLLPLADPRLPGEPPSVGLRPCAAEGCEAHARLNFVYFTYRRSTADPDVAHLVFDPTDSESLLYSQSESYDGRDGGWPFLSEHSFHVVPVPLPASLVLLLPALGGLSWLSSARGAAKRRESRA